MSLNPKEKSLKSNIENEGFKDSPNKKLRIGNTQTIYLLISILTLVLVSSTCLIVLLL